MSLAPMAKIAIFIPNNLKNELLSLLQKLETVEITECSVTDLSPYSEQSPEAVVDRIAELEADLKKVGSSIKLLREKFRPKQGIIEQFASLRTPVSEELFVSVAQEPGPVMALCDQVQDLERRWSDLMKSAADYQRILDELTPWLNLDAPLDEVGNTLTTVSRLGSIESRELTGLTAELAALTDVPVHLEVISEQGQRSFLFCLYQRQDQELVQTLLSKYGFSEAKLPQSEADPKTEHRRLQAKLSEITEKANAVHAELARLNEAIAKLLSLNDILSFELKKATVAQLFGDTGHVLFINGWCREADFARTKEAIESTFPVAVVEELEPAEDEVPPVALSNPKLVEPYETITTTAGIPAPGSADPTPAFAPFFFIFFGMALGDAGYGVILAIMALWLTKRTRAVGDGLKFLRVLFMGGLASFIFGVLTGSWFGNLLPIPTIWFNPAEDPLKMLIVSLALGVVHLFVGLGVTFVHNLRQGRIWDAIFDQGLWWVFIGGLCLILIGFSTVGKAVAIAGGVGLVLTQGRHEKSWIKKFFKGLMSLTDVSSWLGDVLSYSRLLALGLASGVIGVVINDVSRMVSGVPVVGLIAMGLILSVGHVFNLLINVISAYVHSSRLQYVEFFGKCFESGGRLFEPFALRTKLVQVIPDQEQNLSN